MADALGHIAPADQELRVFAGHGGHRPARPGNGYLAAVLRQPAALLLAGIGAGDNLPDDTLGSRPVLGRDEDLPEEAPVDLVLLVAAELAQRQVDVVAADAPVEVQVAKQAGRGIAHRPEELVLRLDLPLLDDAIGDVADDHHELVLAARDDPRLGVDRPVFVLQLAFDELDLARVERSFGGVHDRFDDVGRKGVADARPDVGLRVDALLLALGRAEVEVNTFARQPEHGIRERFQERPVPRLHHALLADVADHHHPLVVAARDDAGFRIHRLAVRRADLVLLRLDLAGFERLLGQGHALADDLGRDSVSRNLVDARADDRVGRQGEHFGSACVVVEVHAVAREPEHRVGNRLEERLPPRRRQPLLGDVADDHHELVLAARDDPRIGEAAAAARHVDLIFLGLRLTRLERTFDEHLALVHRFARDHVGGDVVEALPDHFLGWDHNVLGIVRVDVEDRAVARAAEHRVRDGIEQRAAAVLADPERSDAPVLLEAEAQRDGHARQQLRLGEQRRVVDDRGHRPVGGFDLGHRPALLHLLEADWLAVDVEVTRRVVEAVDELGRGIAERVAKRVLRLDERRRLLRVRKQRAHVQPRQPGAQDPPEEDERCRDEAGDEADSDHVRDRLRQREDDDREGEEEERRSACDQHRPEQAACGGARAAPAENEQHDGERDHQESQSVEDDRQDVVGRRAVRDQQRVLRALGAVLCERLPVEEQGREVRAGKRPRSR